MESCIFCKIINQEIPGHVIYEDEHVLAFLDISQTTKGHTLVIPKKHVENVFEMNETDMTQVFSVVPKLANSLRETFKAAGMNIINNNDKVAGQTVFHYHVHLIPRYHMTDTIKIQFSNHMDSYPPEKLRTLKDEVKNNLTANG